jgi:hypothetical protein
MATKKKLQPVHPIEDLMFNRIKNKKLLPEPKFNKQRRLCKANCSFGLYCSRFHTSRQMKHFSELEKEGKKEFYINEPNNPNIRYVYNCGAFDRWFNEELPWIYSYIAEDEGLDEEEIMRKTLQKAIEIWIDLEVEEREYWAIDNSVVRGCIDAILK